MMRVSCGAGLALTWRGAAPCVRSRSRPWMRRPAPSCAAATTRPTTPRTAALPDGLAGPRRQARARDRPARAAQPGHRPARPPPLPGRRAGRRAPPHRPRPDAAPSRRPGRPSCCASSSWTRMPSACRAPTGRPGCWPPTWPSRPASPSATRRCAQYLHRPRLRLQAPDLDAPAARRRAGGLPGKRLRNGVGCQAPGGGE